MPLSSRSPRSSSSKPAPSSRRVASAITTWPGAAIPCRRAARFGVSPTTACSCAAPSPTRSPTTTRPVAMPTRAASASPAGLPQLADRRGDRQPRPDGPLGLVLMRPRPAEIGQHAVAHELGDVALEARDLARHRVLIAADHLAHVLGIEPRRQRGRADQIDEHHRQLPPLGLARGRRLAARGRFIGGSGVPAGLRGLGVAAPRSPSAASRDGRARTPSSLRSARRSAPAAPRRQSSLSRNACS